MKIAIFTRAYITQVWGGIPSVCRTLAEGLVGHGCEVHVITTGHTIEEEVLNGVRIHYVRCMSMQYTDAWYAGAHQKYLELGPFDVAYSESGANGPFIDQLDAVKICRLHGVSYEEAINHLNLIYVKGRQPDDNDFRIIRERYIQYFKDIEILKKYDCLVAISNVSADIMRYRFFHENVVTIYNAVDNSFFLPPDTSHEWHLRFVAAGKNDPRKGFDTIRQAIAIAQQSIPEIELVIAQGMSQDELIELYRTSCAFIDASNHFTGMNTACMEAMACGLPVICSNLENFQEMTHGDQVYFPLGDVNALAQAIINMCIPEVRQRYSANAIFYSGKFRQEMNINKHIGLFQCLLRRRQ